MPCLGVFSALCSCEMSQKATLGAGTKEGSFCGSTLAVGNKVWERRWCQGFSRNSLSCAALLKACPGEAPLRRFGSTFRVTAPSQALQVELLELLSEMVDLQT